MTARVHLVSVDELITALTRIAAIADNALYKRTHSNASIRSTTLREIKDEALNAIARAEEPN